MSKLMFIAASILLIGGLFGTGCKPEMVGAPCTPETDKGVYNKDMAKSTYAVETRSVQCKTAICLTKTATQGTPGDDVEGVSEYDRYKDYQTKFSFCSCRCQDAEGHKYDRNNDKYDDLCECPPNTKCVQILGNNIADAPEKVKGSYCIPNCIADGCVGYKQVNGQDVYQQCLPSSDSDEPWKWKCRFPKD